MAVTDLAGTTWVFNDTIETDSLRLENIHMEFTSNETTFTSISKISTTILHYDNTAAYIGDLNGWTRPGFKKIYIISSIRDPNVIAWLEANATIQIEADVEISYKGAQIAAINDSGAVTLGTGGKYCTDDITVNYKKPTGGGKLYIFTGVGYTNTSAMIGTGSYLNADLAYHSEALEPGVTVTFYTYGDYILDSITGDSSGTTYPFTTVARGHYTFTMPDESVYCALLYDD